MDKGDGKVRYSNLISASRLDCQGDCTSRNRVLLICDRIENIMYTTKLMTIPATREYIRYQWFHYIYVK
jgi:hypothetical protein